MGFSAAGARQKLVELNAAFEAKKRAEAEQFRCFAEFADQYRYVPDEGPVLSGTERLLQWGGDGTPGVAEFCTLESLRHSRCRRRRSAPRSVWRWRCGIGCRGCGRG